MGGKRRAFHVFHHDDVITIAFLIGLSLCATHVEGGAIARKDTSVYSEQCVDHSFSVVDAKAGKSSCNTDLTQVFNILNVSDSTVLLGSTECLYALDTNLTYVASFTVSPYQGGCTFGTADDIEGFICKNYFSFGIEESTSSFYVCGTYNAQYPRCWNCSLNSETQTLSCVSNVPTVNMPRDPVTNHTVLLTNGKFYAGGSATLSYPAESPVFARIDVGSGLVEVKTSANDLWIKAPKDFVGDPIEYGDHVYFFYREKAEENTIEKIIYSRVARVCKDEAGGSTSPLDGEFTTFLKTRLLCSYGQIYPAMYDEVQDVERSTYNNDIIYALFTTPNAGMVSSAICRYSLAELKALFDSSDRRGQPTTAASWQRIPRHADDTLIRRQCQSPYPSVTSLYDHLEKYPLMNDNALNCGFGSSCNAYSGRSAEDALAILEGIAGQRLALKDETDDDIVVYVGTNNRQIYRVDIDSAKARITQRVTLPDTDMKDAADLAVKWPYGISDLIIRNDKVYGTIDHFAFTFPAGEPKKVQNKIVSLSEDKSYTFPAKIHAKFATHIFKTFEAPEGSNINASLSGGLPNDLLTLTCRRFNVVAPSGNKEILHCTIQVQKLTASVTATLTVTSTTDMVPTLTMPINIMYDGSKQYVPRTSSTNVNEYDNDLATYEHKYRKWLKSDVRCRKEPDYALQQLDTCPTECSSCANVP